MTVPAKSSQPGPGLPADLLDRVIAFSQVHTYSTGQSIHVSGSTTNSFYYLLSGAVEVTYTDPHDNRITSAHIGPGELFGEIEYFDGESRVRDIQAVGEARVVAFDDAVMAELRHRQPELYMDFLLLLTRNIRINNYDIIARSFSCYELANTAERCFSIIS